MIPNSGRKTAPAVRASERILVRPDLSNLRVALVHDLLTQQGGGERVLDVLHRLWPTAPIYTLLYRPAVFGDRYAGAEIRTSFIQRLPNPGGVAAHKWYLPLMPWATETFDLSAFDLVISDASAFAKGVKVPPHIPHVCYLHTPTRYLWNDRESYLKTAPVPPFARPVLSLVMPALQRWDYRAAQRPTAIIANSETVAERCRRYYQRSPDAVVFPPVNAAQFTRRATTQNYWFTVSRIEPYKRLDLILDAFVKLGWPLKVAGTGSRATDLARWAGAPNIEFVGRVTDDALAQLYGEARAVVFAAHEDAGIVPLEAMAAGRPVLAYGAGGSLESIVPGVTGAFFAEQSVPALVAALRAFQPDSYDAATIRAHALHFAEPAFADKIQTVIADHLTKHQEAHGAR